MGKDTGRLFDRLPVLGETQNAIRRILIRETALFTGLLFFGFVVMPIGIYLVGDNVFGAYGGNGYGHFFAGISGRIRVGDQAAWFLVLSPYLAVQLVRLLLLAWRATGRSQTSRVSRPPDEISQM